MRDLLYIAWGAGVHDGLNPCIFMTCAMFIVSGAWLKSRSFSAGWPRLVFSFVYFLGFLIFAFTTAQLVVLRKDIFLATRVLYFVLGAMTFVLGVLFFKDWFLLRRGMHEYPVEKPKLSLPGTIAVYLGVIISALLLSAMATYWPIDKYITVLGTEELMRGRWKEVVPMLLVYVFSSMWALWLLWAFLSVKNLKPSLIKIVCSGIFFTASTCMILMFR